MLSAPTARQGFSASTKFKMEALKDYLPDNRWTNGNRALCTQEETLLGGKQHSQGR